MTDLELQRWLAAQLPEEFDTTSYSDSGGSLVCWKGLRCRPVNHREWPHVVSLVEAKAKLDPQVWHNYGVTLARLVLREENAYFGEGGDAEPNLNGIGFAELSTLSWQQRTRALMEVLK